MSTTRAGRRLGWSLTIYCTKEENVQIRAMVTASTCRSFSEYARKVLLSRPVAVTHRNLSLDALIEQLNALRELLDEVLRRDPGPVEKQLVLLTLEDIKLIANNINELCIPV